MRSKCRSKSGSCGSGRCGSDGSWNSKSRGVGKAGVAEAGVAEAGVVGVAEEVVVAETGVAGKELMEAAREVLEGVVEEILEVVAVGEMVAQAWKWLDKRLWAGFGLDLGWPQAVHTSKIWYLP